MIKGIVVITSVYPDNKRMYPVRARLCRIVIWLLFLTSALVILLLVWNTIPLALIPTLFWLFVLAIPGSILLGFRLARHAHYSRYAPLSILVAVLGVSGVLVGFIWDVSLETLQKAARSNSTQWLTVQLDNSRLGPDVVDTHGSSLLMIAAQHGNTEVLKGLLRRGARTNYRDGDGDTALRMAERYGHKECVRLLLAAGAHR
jgi:Ankyrin repeats (3 copies)